MLSSLKLQQGPEEMHENLVDGGSGIADLKNGGNHDVSPVFPAKN